MEENIQAVSGLLDTLVEFAVQYGFQILGALVVLLIGLKVASFAGRKVTTLCETKNIDVTLSRFIGNVVKIILVVMVVIVTLGNFGISIAPFIALAGASAFGATLAIQGPLSNYGAGLSIILARPFVVGNTINVQGVSGVVHEITLAQTVLVGEDGEKISIPNKEVVGQVIVNSREKRVVQTKIQIGAGPGRPESGWSDQGGPGGCARSGGRSRSAGRHSRFRLWRRGDRGAVLGVERQVFRDPVRGQ